MAWRILYIEKPCRLTEKNFQINLSFEKGDIAFPLEDVAAVVIDTPAATLTSALMSAMGKHNIILINCNEKHLPSYISLSSDPNARKVQSENLQLNMTVPLKKRIWQSIVIQKITNQGNCLKLLNIRNYSKILKYAKSVTSGDGENAEAVAANRYFSFLFGSDFARREEDNINIALNYGYSIVRSLTARAFAASGFILSRGVFHHNELNSYNLADDFMEPYRPIIDFIVYNYFRENPCEDEILLSVPKDLKNRLLEVIEYTVFIDGKRHSVRRSSEIMASSFLTALKENDYRLLKTPAFDKAEYYSYE